MERKREMKTDMVAAKMAGLSKPQKIMALVAVAIILFPVLLYLRSIYYDDSAPGAKTLSPIEAQALLANGAIALDIRGREAYERIHITADRSTFLEPAELENNGMLLPAHLRAGKQTLRLLIYGHRNSAAPAEAAKSLVRHEFANVSILRGGIEEWEKAGLPIYRRR
jgi:rhodanese-related sulfurtransferase